MSRGKADVACLLLWAGIVMMYFFPLSAYAGTCEEWIAKVVSVQGSVEVRKAGETQWSPVKFNDLLCPRDIIRVNEKSRAEIKLSNEATLRLDQKSVVTFLKREKEKTLLMDFLNGAVQFFSRVPRSLDIVTPSVNAAIKGTEFFMRVEDTQTVLSVFEGEVIAENASGSLTMGRGQSAVAVRGMAPELRTVVRPRDAVQWALYYPPVLSYSPSDFKDGLPSDWQAMVKRSLEFSMKGDIPAAFESIAGVPEDVRDPRFFTYRASLLLTVGRVDEARSDIDKALNLSPSHSNAFALQSVISVVLNEKEKALNLARKAVETDTHSAPALIALSYAQQANFDLQGALNSLKEAVKLDPENALAWARLSELQLSFAHYDEALEAAQKAVTLNPDLSRTQTVLGYAYLSEVKIKDSKDAFERAIKSDQADPLPRLGLGLAKIREGDLKEGREEIEIAVGLDPDNSLIRSYLGKAYYEEKRDEKASDQFNAAKDFDPKDPTPWFYDAIMKQSINRPVEALHDLQKAIELNDNRAVYRSKLLLDEDLAARSASLARIYTDLGFQQLALVEGWKSVNADPSDFSGHRFLADSYSALPRHEIARVSELLQSQLLQPINITPAQPSLAEANLFILEGAGPSSPSFNEFNPLFNRNRVALQLSGVTGSNSTWGDEVVVSGVYNKLSFSAGQFHYETNGFRPNNDLTQNIYDVFAQLSITPQTSIQAEFRARDVDKGDLELRFFMNPNYRQTQTQKMRSMRAGFHHAFAPGSDLIANIAYQDLQEDTYSKTISPSRIVTFDNSLKQTGYVIEAQYLFRSASFNIISGGGFFTADQKNTITVTPGPPNPTPTEKDLQNVNFYIYSLINYPQNVIMTIGGSAVFFKGGLIDRDQFNPKIGLTWNPLPGTTLRAALFRNLQRSFINDQTLEPTQVAGFNQFYDDTDGTESWMYGVAIDQKIARDFYGGAEYSSRNLEVPFVSITPNNIRRVGRVDWKERLGRVYLNWTPHEWLALYSEYNYERLDRDREFIAGIEHLTTHRFPIGINFYHPSGFIAMAKAMYVDQKGTFLPQGKPTTISGSDQFWLVDASLGYRLPKRLGLITVGVKNLFDKSFRYQDIDRNNPAIQPERFIFVKTNFSL